MKKTVVLLIAMIISTGIVAQAPSTFSFQAVIRDTNNQVVANSPIGMKTTILQSSTDGIIVYQEIYDPNPMTNINGLVTLEVGNGFVLSGDFAAIDWSDGPYFIKTEADPTGGTIYTITGIVQLLSVPYALHAQTADNLSYEIEETDPVFTASPAAGITGASVITWDTAFSWGDHSLADYLTAETDPTWSGANNTTDAIGRTGNVGIGTTTPDAQLHTTGSVRFAGAGEPGAGKVLTSDVAGNATWEPPFAMPTGSNMQTLRHDGSAWVANSLLRNNGTGLGIGANPIANTQLHLFRTHGNFGPGYANIYAIREGHTSPENGGTSWGLNGVDAAIKGYSNWGNNFSAALAGYGWLDFVNSAAVIGSNFAGSTYGALAFKDANNFLWAGYFNGNVNITGTMRIQGGSPGEGKILTSDANGNATWQSQAGISPLSCIDIEGNAYPTIVIGNQVWMAENLRVTKYNNGEDIPNVTGDAAWGALTTGAYCWYNNNQSANAKYGALYNWYAVNDPRGLCPEGWRVPTDAEWTAFTNMLGGAGVAGGKLKAVSPLWNDPNTDATNSTGFSALPSGFRWSNGSFLYVGSDGYWWSATESGGTNAWRRRMGSSFGDVNRSNSNKRSGFSVRCLRDN